MLTTRRPHHRGAAAPSATNARVPPELDAVALKALAPNPQSRFQSAVSFASELRSVGALLDARNLAEDEDVPVAKGSSKVAPIVAAIVTLLGAGAAVWWWLQP